jgi:putative transferase (TIGR04331 family)
MQPMKANFVVSAYRPIWLSGARRLFAIDAYIPHVLEREGRISPDVEIQVAPLTRSTRAEFESDHAFVDQKFRRYAELMIARFDEAHGTQYGGEFWRKAMSLALMRHVTFCYDLFKACETYLDPELHEAQVLDSLAFRTPNDFEEHRQIFQNTELGQEQLFSVYCNLFHTGLFPAWMPPAPETEETKPIDRAEAGARSGGLLSRLARRFLRMVSNPSQILQKGLEGLLGLRDPRLAVIECSFAPSRLRELRLKSMGRIQPLALPSMQFSTAALDWQLRNQLVREESDFDRFDTFVFACLRHSLPRIFVEDFKKAYATLDQYSGRFRKLSWVVCEWWISNTWSSLALAVLKQKGIKHIYNEHNYLSYFFVGNNLKYIAPIVDEFVTMGWTDSSTPNLVRGSSLFPWCHESGAEVKEHDILLVCGLPLAHVPEVTSAYGDSGAYRAVEYFDMNSRFLMRLGDETLAKVCIRSYPAAWIRNWLTWDQKFALAAYVKKAKTYDDSSRSGRELMRRSRLIVVNYLSTSYLESIIADIPTIVLWNQRTNLFTTQYSYAFDSLIESEICHTDPEKAADFINKVKADPQLWWQSQKVREGRQMFLDANVGKPEVMIKYLLNKAH